MLKIHNFKKLSNNMDLKNLQYYLTSANLLFLLFI